MLGSDFQVMIPSLSEIRVLEQKMDTFKQERKKFLEQYELGKLVLNKIEKRESSNFVSNGQAEELTKKRSLSTELNMTQVLEDKANVDQIWEDLGLETLLKQSKFLWFWVFGLISKSVTRREIL